MIFFWVFGLISIFILTLFCGFDFWVEMSTNYFILYMANVTSLFFWRKIKALFGMLYINLLNLKDFIWFWSRIWGFYKFGSFKFWGFWYLRLSRLILIIYLKCYLFGFMWFFIFLIKAMIFGWLIICLDSTQKIMELGVIILILFHILNCLYCYYYN